MGRVFPSSRLHRAPSHVVWRRLGGAVVCALSLLITSAASAILVNGQYVANGTSTFVYTCGTLTSLADGRALVVGHGQAEVYDPSTGVWSLTGQPVADRCYFTSTLLPGGKVLIAGGYVDGGTAGPPSAGTEIYDPASGTWTAGPSMVSPRAEAVAVALADGRVLIVAGTPDPTSPAEVYDPATNEFAATGSMLSARITPSAIRLDDGRVLVAGGFSTNSVSNALATAETYDPTLGTWSATGSMATAHSDAGIVGLGDGRILIAGGDAIDNRPVADAEIYNAASGVWTNAAPILGTTSSGRTPLLLATGHVLWAHQVYDPRLDAWYPTRSSASPGHGGAVPLADGSVLLMPDINRVSELYRPMLASARTDFTRDGRSDIVFENGPRRWLYSMNGTSVQSWQAMPASAPGWVIAGIGDFDGNGCADLLYRSTSSTTDYWIVLLDGTSVIGDGYLGVAPGYLPTFIADFDGDGRADIVWEDPSGGRWIFFMNGLPVASFVPVPPAERGWEIAGVGDFDGDGKADLLWMNVTDRSHYWVYLLNAGMLVGNGSFNGPFIHGNLTEWIGDLSRDGNADILWDSAGFSWLVTLMSGASPVASFQLSLPFPFTDSIVGVGDYDNAGGGLDLLSQDPRNPRHFTVHLLNSSGAVTDSAILEVAPGYVPLSR